MNTTETGSENKGRNRIMKNAGVLFFAGALACGIVACALKENQRAVEDKFAELARQTNAVTAFEDEKTLGERETWEVQRVCGMPVPAKRVDFPMLRKVTNEDIYAWIYVPDTGIDYPVFQHSGDNSYYLDHNLDGSTGYPGCIYTEDYNKKDFSDPDTVLYGHNMKDGSMFASLHNYADDEYMAEHPYVYIYTEEGFLVYEIFAAYQTGDRHILYGRDGFRDRKVFAEYIEEVIGECAVGGILREDAEVTVDSRILTMSTCVAGQPDNRFLVQGVLLDGRRAARHTE